MLPAIAVGKKGDSYGPKFTVTKMVAAWNKTAEDTSIYNLGTTTFVNSGTWNSTIDQLGNSLMLTIATNTPDPTGTGDSTTTASTVTY
jgi:hypothetical protein